MKLIPCSKCAGKGGHTEDVLINISEDSDGMRTALFEVQWVDCEVCQGTGEMPVHDWYSELPDEENNKEIW